MIKPKFTLAEIPLSYFSLTYTLIALIITNRIEAPLLMGVITVVFYLIERFSRRPKKINYKSFTKEEIKKIFRIR